MSQASAGPDEPTTLPAPTAEQSPGPAWVDLASHRPGHAVLAHIASLLAPLGGDVQPAGASPTPEGVGPWAVGFVGEEKVGLELALLDDRWRVLHGVPISHEGFDIDHVVIGPPGVFTINTKHHRGKRLNVRGEDVFIGPTYQPYVPKARREAERARAALTADLSAPCPVTPVICTVGANLRYREATSDVWVVEGHRLIASLTAQHTVLSTAQVDWLYDRARRSTTWTDTPPPAPAPAWVAEYARRLATPPARPLAATASARSRPGARVGRPVPARPRRASTRRRKAAPTRSPSRQLFTILALFAFLLMGPQTITAVTRAITGPLVAALPSTPAAPGTDQGGTPAQYLASDDLPIAASGGSCPRKKARARYPLGDHLLMCRPDADKELTWQFADPWRRLPAALEGTSCEKIGDHAQSVTERRTALLCAKDEQRMQSWIPDPGWEPKP